MMLLITLALMGITAWVAFVTGQRWEIGKRERQLETLAEQRERRGRRGTVRLNPITIRR